MGAAVPIHFFCACLSPQPTPEYDHVLIFILLAMKVILIVLNASMNCKAFASKKSIFLLVKYHCFFMTITGVLFVNNQKNRFDVWNALLATK